VRTKITVISLPDATQRRAAFSARAEDAPVAWSYFDARRELGPDLTYDADEAVVAKARPLRSGELGCYASHYAAWLEFLASDGDQIILLEDDTIVDWMFLAKVAETDLEASGIRYLRLFAKRPCPFRRLRLGAVEPRRYLIEYLDYAYGTQAYVLTRRGAEHFVRHCRVVRRPIDDELDRSWDHGIPCLSVFPFPVIEQATSSSIGYSRFEPFEIPARLRRRRYRSKMTDRALRLRQRLRRLKAVSMFAAALLVGP
jgi:glycosyl transferase family 25